MSVQSIDSPYSSIYNLDKILQDTPETATEELSDFEGTYQIYKEELDQELKAADRVWLEFHAGFCEQFGKAAKSMLYRIVKSSVGYPENSIASANAITILKVMKVSFSCLDLREIQIPGADLSSAILDGADVSGANLENVNLTNASLNSTNMSKVDLRNVKFDMPDTLIHESNICFSIISPDNSYLVSEDQKSMYFWHLPSKSCIKKGTRTGSSHYLGQAIFTPDGQFLFIYDNKQYIDIWAVDSFEHIKKLKISNEKIRDIYFSFSVDATYFITYSCENDAKTHVKIWGIQRTENGILDISLKNEVLIAAKIEHIYFSKKFPVFYCCKTVLHESRLQIYFSIYNVEALFKEKDEQNIDSIPRSIVDVLLLDADVEKVRGPLSLDIFDTSKNCEESVFIAIENFIYPVKVLKINEQNSAFETTQGTEVITEIDLIHNMQVLEKTHELLYVCNNAICLYSIKNNRLVGRFRLFDRPFDLLSVSVDRANIYISYLNKLYVYSLEALKNSKYILYEMDSQAACFFDMNSILSISKSFHMTLYDIETGNPLKTNFLQKMKSNSDYHFVYNIVFSPNNQQILISSVHDNLASSSLHIFNTEDESTYLEATEYFHEFALSSNSEYLALIYPKQTLVIYKTTPYKQCIGRFDLKDKFAGIEIAISTDFLNSPKVALKGSYNTVKLCNFVFRGETLELHSQKGLVKEGSVLRLQFIDNNNKLLIVCKKKIVIRGIEDNSHEEYDIYGAEVSCVDISRDGSLLICYHWDEYDQDTSGHQLSLWSITQKKPLATQFFSLAITKIQISPDNKYIIANLQNGGIHVWRIMGDTFRLLWRTLHNLQTQELILGNNNLEEGFEENLRERMGAITL